ncbi:unnamed protein product [Bursaphelenchus xylophilus]|uniref:(pine wood nematode) hypothetical protein n=1 Tax=Bursaphelenchus xylophilus TaxID=6326 RepID=A0A1I7RK58_BURXY|nr:unnamed protein product [Bursaphelenchus xylophilus]CAG9131485.1 unnamed protein product [Bursaphelenchus xylophilus]
MPDLQNSPCTLEERNPPRKQPTTLSGCQAQPTNNFNADPGKSTRKSAWVGYLMDEPITQIERRESELCSFLRSLLHDRQKYDDYLEFVDEPDIQGDFSWKKFETLILDYQAQNSANLEGAILALDDQLDYISYVEIINQLQAFYDQGTRDTFKARALMVIAITSFGRIYLNFYFKHASKSYMADHNSQLILSFTHRHVMNILRTMDDWAQFDQFLQTYVPTRGSSLFDRVCVMVDRIGLPILGIFAVYIAYKFRIALT